jgi:hypothetical protein
MIEHPPSMPALVDSLGRYRVLGNHPTPPGVLRPRAAAPPLLPESDWVEFELASPDVKVKDQGQYGACNGHAAASSLEWARFVAGYPHEDLSAWMVYAILCGGVDSGSSIGEALDLLEKTGTCLDATVPHGTINPRRLSAQAKAEAPRFRIELGDALDSFDAMMTACQLRRPFNASICVGGSFNDLDSDGCPPVARGAGNHAVCGGIGARKARNGEWLIKFQNSWTTGWGLGGYFWYRRAHWELQRYAEAYEVLAASSDPSDPTKPPVIA